MNITSVMECHVEPEVGMPVSNGNRPPGSSFWDSSNNTIGKIIAVEYLGNYRYQITAEIDENKLAFPFREPGTVYSMSVQNPPILLNEYNEEMEELA